eukprot:GHVQ01020676.1.p1 GENE.GHVQ01020676.1~~GHVQ01020676.1.p1  ORF type:complete len:209 (+),score=23.26 GHVQ01020676.1:498-1124(+)
MLEEFDTARRALRLRRFVQYLQDAFNCIEECRVPVVAAVVGGCVGAGVDLVSACDIRIASADAWFTVKEVDIGLAADLGTLQRLPKIVGNDSWVREVCYTARRFSAEEAYNVGLLSSVEKSRLALQDKSMEICKCIAGKSPVAIAGTKFALRYSKDKSNKEGLLMQSVWNGAMLQTNDIAIAFGRSTAESSRNKSDEPDPRISRFSNL